MDDHRLDFDVPEPIAASARRSAAALRRRQRDGVPEERRTGSPCAAGELALAVARLQVAEAARRIVVIEALVEACRKGAADHAQCVTALRDACLALAALQDDLVEMEQSIRWPPVAH
jgi:hypothetical protein